MSEINSEFIEKYQLIYEKDPNSKVFAPLAEAYRRMGLLAQALRVAERGVKVHPSFPSGQVALAKCYIDTNRFAEAAEHLQTATKLAPENLMGFRLYAKCLFRLRKAKEALAAYKMVLFLNPNDTKAQKVIKKLESLTADEFDDEIFNIDPDQIGTRRTDFIEKKLNETPKDSSTVSFRGLERYISLIDAFIVRNDLERAETAINKAEEEFPSHPEIDQRRQLLRERAQDVIDGDSEEIEPIASRQELIRDKKIELLGAVLRRLNSPDNEATF